MYYYKFNLSLPNLNWFGSKACKIKNLKSIDILRSIKNKKYPFYRIDALFSNTKHTSVRFINDGGWHFTNLKSAEEIEHKLKSYLHHREFDVESLTTEEIKKIMKIRNDILKVTIDSPAAAGAGTQAKLIGKHFNLITLDTGRVYRYVAYIKITEPAKFNYKYIKKKIDKLNNLEIKTVYVFDHSINPEIKKLPVYKIMDALSKLDEYERNFKSFK